MKKLIPFAFIALFALNTSYLMAESKTAEAVTSGMPVSATGTDQSVTNRYDSNNSVAGELTMKDKHAIRKEERVEKREMKQQPGGTIIYISSAAVVIIIVILLIILL